MVDSFGSRTTFFVRHEAFESSDDDPLEPSSGDDDDDSHASDHTMTEPMNLLMENDDNVGINNGSASDVNEVMSHGENEASRNGPSWLGLDDSFKRALNDLGLTSDEANVDLNCKRVGTDLEGSSSKRPRNVDLNLNLDLHVPTLQNEHQDLGANLGQLANAELGEDLGDGIQIIGGDLSHGVALGHAD